MDLPVTLVSPNGIREEVFDPERYINLTMACGYREVEPDPEPEPEALPAPTPRDVDKDKPKTPATRPATDSK